MVTDPPEMRKWAEGAGSKSWGFRAAQVALNLVSCTQLVEQTCHSAPEVPVNLCSCGSAITRMPLQGVPRSVGLRHTDCRRRRGSRAEPKVQFRWKVQAEEIVTVQGRGGLLGSPVSTYKRGN